MKEDKDKCKHKFILVAHEKLMFRRKIVLFCEKCGKHVISKEMDL